MMACRDVTGDNANVGLLFADDELDHGGKSHLDWAWSAPSLDAPDDEIHPGDGLGNSEEHGEWGFHIHDPELRSGDDLDAQEGLFGTSGLSAESLASAIKDIPDPRKRRKKKLKQARLRTISEEDFDDPGIRKVVHLVRLRVESLLKNGPGAEEYFRWFFCGEPDAHGLRLDMLLIPMGLTGDTLRQRLQKYLYLRWVVVEYPPEGQIKPPSMELLDRVAMAAPGWGRRVFEIVWSWPGITEHRLIGLLKSEGMPGESAKRALEAIQEQHWILNIGEFCYAVGYYGLELHRKNETPLWSRLGT